MKFLELLAIGSLVLCVILVLGIVILYFNVEESRPYIVIGVVVASFVFGYISGAKSTRAVLRDGAELGTVRAQVDGEAIKHVAGLGGQMLKHNQQVHKYYNDNGVPIQNPQTEESYFALPGNFTVEE